MSTPTCWCGEPATWYVPAVGEFVCDDDLASAEGDDEFDDEEGA
jgi:hypothetical protein